MEVTHKRRFSVRRRRHEKRRARAGAGATAQAGLKNQQEKEEGKIVDKSREKATRTRRRETVAKRSILIAADGKVAHNSRQRNKNATAGPTGNQQQRKKKEKKERKAES